MTNHNWEYRRKHLQNQIKLKRLYNRAFGRVAQKIANLVNDPHAKNVKSFNFKGNPRLNKIITGFIEEFNGNSLEIVEKGIETSWNISNEKNNETVRRYLRNLSALKGAENTFLNTNQGALKAFLKEKAGGQTLSDRIWRTSQQLREELEIHLGYGIANGDSAAIVSRRVNQYLKNPDALFRRVRDEHGNLKLSQAAKAFNPGRGTYRSAYKNALRVARTETNRAFLYSDHLRWKKMSFVKGVKIELSPQHPVYDICDETQGDYPKNFVFTGWHPQCLCHATPILMPKDDFKKHLRGEKVNMNPVSDVPNGYKGWIDRNKKRVNGWKHKPYFIRDNYLDGAIDKGLKFPTKSMAKGFKATTIPVSQAFSRVSPGATKKYFDEAIKSIESVHGDGDLPKIPLKANSRLKAGGRYARSVNQVTNETKALDITLNPQGKRPELTIVHEIGHFLDDQTIGTSNKFESVHGSLMDGVFDKIMKTPEIKWIENAMDKGSFIAENGSPIWMGKEIRRHFKYLLDKKELFARAYSQFIAEKSNSKILINQVLGSRNNQLNIPYQWESKNFKPVMDEIEKLFKILGWM